MYEVTEIHLLNLLINQLFLIVASNSFNRSIKVEVLGDSQVLKDRIELWTISNQTASLIKAKPGAHVIPAHQ